MTQRKTFTVGIDVGTHSLGCAAIEVDTFGTPTRLLNATVLIHDSGIGPDGSKTATTRLAQRGAARRARRLKNQRRRRLKELDRFMMDRGWPIIALDEQADPYYPWKVRAQLASEKIIKPAELQAMLSVALSHIARHRGWRNPFESTASLLEPQPASEWFVGLQQRIGERLIRDFPPDVTPGQVVAALITAGDQEKLRGPAGLLGGKLHQRDNAHEIRRIAQVQGLPNELTTQLIHQVFATRNPRNSAAQLAGRDRLPGQEHLIRASKSSLAFQHYRVASVVSNLRVSRNGDPAQPPTAHQMGRVIDFLMSPRKLDPSWSDVAEVLGVDRGQLSGTATLTADGERCAGRPPVNVTDRRMRACAVKTVVQWWDAVDHDAQEELVEVLLTGQIPAPDTAARAMVAELLASLSEVELSKLMGLNLPAGRAAYSRQSLQRLTTCMEKEGVDLFQARKRCFGVPDDWTPPADPIGQPVGNPAVDRVTKALARWLQAVEREWGRPQSITIEHVRSGFTSENVARKIDRENNARADANRILETEIRKMLQEDEAARRVSHHDINRYRAVTRQNGQCLYCGISITYTTCEMDHIVPRKGIGSNNRRENLAAACKPCNQAKSNQVFSVWAQRYSHPEVSVEKSCERVKHFLQDTPFSKKEFHTFQRDVISRLKRTTEDPEFDGRSMESVAWMAIELRTRILHHFENTIPVHVYRGQITAEARKAAGLDKSLSDKYLSYQLTISEPGKSQRRPYRKSRLDRRHHAIDAAVMALMSQAVSTTLAERLQLKDQEQMSSGGTTWKDYTGSDFAHQTLYHRWKENMQTLGQLLAEALIQDHIPVMTNLRLRVGDGQAHDAMASKFTSADRIAVGAQLSPQLIDRASTPALWCALTRHPDYSPDTGLPANPARTITVNGTRFGPDETVNFFPTSAAAIALRGGYADIGDTIHHARIYRVRDKKGKPSFFMMRVYCIDLLKHTHQDVFEVAIPPQTISRRACTQKLRKALNEGSAEYLGWLVVGDQLRLRHLDADDGLIGKFLTTFPHTTLWRVDGFPGDAKLRLRPVMLAGEGLPSEAANSACDTILNGQGWRASVNVVFSDFHPMIIRRDTLGRPRLTSKAHLPVCWTVSE